MRILAHRTIQKLNFTAGAFKLFYDQHLVNEAPRRAVGAGNQYSLKAGTTHSISQLIQAGSIQTGPAVPVISEKTILRQRLSFPGQVSLQTLHLLLNGLCLRLPIGRDPNVDRGYFHWSSPFVWVRT